MVLKQDISKVVEYLGKKGSFQFQTKFSEKGNLSESEAALVNIDKEVFNKLSQIKTTLGIETISPDISKITVPTDEDRIEASRTISAFDELNAKIDSFSSEAERVSNAYKAALSFANLKVPY